MYKYKNKGSLVKILQLIIDYRQESSEVTPQTLIINALRFWEDYKIQTLKLCSRFSRTLFPFKYKKEQFHKNYSDFS